MADRIPNYIERVARDVWVASLEMEPWYPDDEASLWLGYAVLAMAKGDFTTSKDVHEAWSAWATVRYGGTHRSLVPFDELAPQIQAYDDLYRDAIHRVARATEGCPRRMTADDAIAELWKL